MAASVSMITQKYETSVCRADTVEVSVPTPIYLEAGHTYAFMQKGTTSVAPLVVCVQHSGVLHSLQESLVTGTENEYIYTDSGNAPGLVVSYHVRNSDGSTSRVRRVAYESTLHAKGYGYLRLSLPASLPTSHSLILKSSDLQSNLIRLDLVEPAYRVRTGDYLWLEVEQQKRVVGTNLWSDTHDATVGVLAERLSASVDLVHDNSLKEEDLY